MSSRRATAALRLQHRVPLVLAFGTLVVLLGGGGFAALESDVVSSYWEGVWWALSLMMTVGFVGETPVTTAGRVLSAVLMVFGFGLITFTTAAIASFFVREQEAPVEAAEHEFEQLVTVRLDEFSARLAAIEAAVEELSRRPSPPAGD